MMTSTFNNKHENVKTDILLSGFLSFLLMLLLPLLFLLEFLRFFLVGLFVVASVKMVDGGRHTRPLA